EYGFYSGAEHRAYHRALRERHEDFHEDHPGTRHDHYRRWWQPPPKLSCGHVGHGHARRVGRDRALGPLPTHFSHERKRWLNQYPPSQKRGTTYVEENDRGRARPARRRIHSDIGVRPSDTEVRHASGGRRRG